MVSGPHMSQDNNLKAFAIKISCTYVEYFFKCLFQLFLVVPKLINQWETRKVNCSIFIQRDNIYQ